MKTVLDIKAYVLSVINTLKNNFEYFSIIFSSPSLLYPIGRNEISFHFIHLVFVTVYNIILLFLCQ